MQPVQHLSGVSAAAVAVAAAGDWRFPGFHSVAVGKPGSCLRVPPFAGIVAVAVVALAAAFVVYSKPGAVPMSAGSAAPHSQRAIHRTRRPRAAVAVAVALAELVQKMPALPVA